MKIPINNVGQFGIISDLPNDELPPNAWSNGQNVRFVDNAVHTVLGEEEIYVNATPPAKITPMWILAGRSSTGILWGYPGRTGASIVDKVYATDGATHFNITRASGDYTGGLDALWNGCVLGGIGYFNNGVDVPQIWNPLGTTTQLVDMANWNVNAFTAPNAWRCKVLRGWKGFLLALDTTEDSVNYLQRFRWSTQTEIGAEPVSWDHTNPQLDARYWDFTESDGALMDCHPLGDRLFIYKEDEVHRAEFIGYPNIFKFRGAFDSFGIMAQRCVKNTLDGRMQIVVTRGDVIAHDGSSVQSLLDDKMRRWFVGAIDSDAYTKTFLTPHYEENEFWVCYRPVGHSSGDPFQALIINIKDGTTTIQDLPEVSHAGWDFLDLDAGVTTFDSQTTPFDSMVGKFGQRTTLPGRRRIVWCAEDAQGSGNGGFVLQDESFTHYDGTNISSYVERLGLTLTGQDRQGQYTSDPSIVKHLTAIWPRARVSNGTIIKVSAAVQQRRDGGIEWQGPFDFEPGVDERVEFDLEGALLGVKFENEDGGRMFIDGYDLEIEIVGETV